MGIIRGFVLRTLRADIFMHSNVGMYFQLFGSTNSYFSIKSILPLLTPSLPHAIHNTVSPPSLASIYTTLIMTIVLIQSSKLLPLFPFKNKLRHGSGGSERPRACTKPCCCSFDSTNYSFEVDESNSSSGTRVSNLARCSVCNQWIKKTGGVHDCPGEPKPKPNPEPNPEPEL